MSAYDELAQLNERFTDADFDKLEADLKLRAACLGWTGEPLRQPPDVVLEVARRILAEKEANA